MADKKISALTGASTPLAGTEVLPIVQGGSTVKVAVSDLTAGRAVSVLELNSSGNVNVLASNAVRLYTTSNANYCTFYNAGTTSANDIRLNTDAGNLIKATDTALSFPLGATFNTNNLTQGTAAKGINFTANTPTTGSTSQLLNWYEEGTYTGTLTPGTSGTITVNSSINKLSFTRIGRIMYVTGLLRASSVSSPVGTVIQLNLPTTIASGNYYTRCGGAIFGTVAGTIAVLPWQADEGTSFITIFVTASTFIAGDEFRVDMFYITA